MPNLNFETARNDRRKIACSNPDRGRVAIGVTVREALAQRTRPPRGDAYWQSRTCRRTVSKSRTSGPLWAPWPKKNISIWSRAPARATASYSSRVGEFERRWSTKPFMVRIRSRPKNSPGSISAHRGGSRGTRLRGPKSTADRARARPRGGPAPRARSYRAAPGMRVLIDENLGSPRLASRPRAEGHEPVLARHAGLSAHSDARVLIYSIDGIPPIGNNLTGICDLCGPHFAAPRRSGAEDNRELAIWVS